MARPLNLTALLWLLYFLVPSEGRLVDGLPLGRLDTIGVVLVVWIAAHRVRIAGAWIAAGAAVAFAVMSAAVPGHAGLNARYFATTAADGAHERSVEYRGRDFTRIDARLDFSRGQHDFPLAFFNDHTRFNFMREGEPNRRFLGFAAAWTGWWWSEGGPRTLFLRAPQASATLAIDTVPVLTATPESADQTTERDVSAGWHRVHITFSSPYGAPREFSIGEMRDGVPVPFSALTTRTDRIDQRQRVVERALAIGKPVADAIALSWLSVLAGLLVVRRAGELWRGRLAAPGAALAIFAAGGAIEAMRFAWPWAERLRLMAAGDDTMVYEGYARDILLNGVLMNGGLPLGQGEPFYFQAFYPYFLASMHALFGEGFFGALFVQRFLVALTAVTITRMAMALRGSQVWPVALLVSTSFLYWKLAPISADLLSEALYVPLLMAWTLSCLVLGSNPTPARAAWAGFMGGLTVITRTTSLLAWPLVWTALFLRLRHSPARARTITVLIASSLAVFSLIAVRNALVSHRFAPMPTEFGITLRGGNEPPGGLQMSTARKAVYDRLRLDGHTAEVIEYAFAAPGAFTANLGRKALFVLGFYEVWVPGWGYSPVYIAAWVSALAGCYFLRRGSTLRLASARSGQANPITSWLPLAIALTQYAVMVIVYPKGERLIVPIHTLLIPYSAIAAYELWARATRSR
jgi:hypothetical protein